MFKALFVHAWNLSCPGGEGVIAQGSNYDNVEEVGLVRAWRCDALSAGDAQGKSAEQAALSVASGLTPQALGVRAYLEQTVVPLLLEGMNQLVNDRCVCPLSLVWRARLTDLNRRPENPVEYLAVYLLKNNPQKPPE